VRVAILGMTNSSNANAALPQLQQAAERLDRINALVEELPPAARQGVANALAPTTARLNQLFDKILASPEVASVAKPTIDQVHSKLAALSRT
jgi:phosphoglycerate-specific signal transduction histidine kinase